jgi:hypothetical protein
MSEEHWEECRQRCDRFEDSGQRRPTDFFTHGDDYRFTGGVDRNGVDMIEVRSRLRPGSQSAQFVTTGELANDAPAQAFLTVANFSISQTSANLPLEPVERTGEICAGKRRRLTSTELDLENCVVPVGSNLRCATRQDHQFEPIRGRSHSAAVFRRETFQGGGRTSERNP